MTHTTFDAPGLQGDAPATVPPRRPARALRIVAALAISLMGLVAIAFLVLQAPAVQVAIGERVLAALDDEIQGSIRVGRFDEVSLGRLRVHDVVFSDPSGAPVLVLDDAVMELELTALFEKRVSVSSAQVDGARLHITQHGERLGLDEAFRSMSQGGGGGGGIVVDLRAIAFRDLLVVMTVPGTPQVRATLAEGTVAVGTTDRGVPLVSFEDVRGELSVESPSLSLTVADATGEFDGAARERFVLTVDGRLEDERFPVTLRLFERSRGRLAARVTVDSSEGGMLADLSILALKTMDTAADGSLRVDDRADRADP